MLAVVKKLVFILLFFLFFPIFSGLFLHAHFFLDLKYTNFVNDKMSKQNSQLI